MNSRVRIVKQSKNGSSKSLPDVQDEKTGRRSDREIANTVKSWIDELELRRLSRRTQALRAIK